MKPFTQNRFISGVILSLAETNNNFVFKIRHKTSIHKARKEAKYHV